MPPLAHATLAASIALSALGAVVICVLTAVYGFTPSEDEPAAHATRRTLLTRVGHAVAASCFAGTAILLAVVLVQSSRAIPPPGDTRVLALAAKVDAQTLRLQGVEQRLKDSEQTLERVETQITEVATRRVPPEPSAAPATTRPRSAAPSTRSLASASSPADARRAAVVARPRPTAPATAPPAVAPAESPAPRPIPATEADEPAASPSPPVVSAAAPPASARAPRAQDVAPRADFASKLRDDWRAIRRGWSSAGDDFRRAIAPLRSGE